MVGCTARIRHGLWRFAIIWWAAMGFTIACIGLPTNLYGQAATSSVTPPLPSLVVQFNGNTTRMPGKRPYSRKSGLALSVDPRWSNSYGYRPVEVTVTSPKPTTADHVITIRLHAGWNRNVTVEQVFEFPLGNTSAMTTVSLPTYQTPMNYFWWDVWIDGVKDKDLSVEHNSAQAWMGGSSGTSANLTFLVAGPSRLDRSLVATSALDFEALTLNLAEFPTRWIDYTSLDVVALSLSEAQQLAKQNPESFEAIGRWVRTGGQLWICEVGGKLEHLPEVSKLLQLPDELDSVDREIGAGNKADKSDKAAEQASDDQSDDAGETEKAGGRRNAQPGWHSLKFQRGNPNGEVITFLDVRTSTSRTVRDPEVISQLQNDPNFVTTEQKFEPPAAGSERQRANDSSTWFVEQDMGLGAVRAFRGANEVAKLPQTPAAANPNAVANANVNVTEELPRALSMGLRRTQRWDSRHGMTPDSANGEFAKFLVPGVGLAPVNEFRVLITLFVLLIGPVNYWLLKRAKRLHLLVLTVPLAALVTTVALFGYAIVADGFDTRVRAQSFTTLDQSTGEAACWARLSYYSGLAPGKGLTMPADIAMYPILPSWAGDSELGEDRELIWSANEAGLSQGWLNSRTPTQYLTVRSRKTPHKLDVLDAGDKLRVINRLGTHIKTLLVINEKGKIYLGEGVAKDSTAGLKPIERADAVRRINRLITDNTPQAPAALAAGDSELSALRSRSRYQMYGRNVSQYNSGRLSDNLAGDALADLAGLAGRPALELPPRSYVAITETGPEVEVGISYAKEEASFHVVLGKW